MWLPHQVIIDGRHPRDSFCGHGDRLSLRLGLDETPEIDNPVCDRDVQFVNMRPRLLLQLVHEPLANVSVGEAYFELRPRARDGLNDVGAADNTDQITSLADDGDAFDVVFFKQVCNFVEKCFGVRCLDVPCHDVRYLHRVGLDVICGDGAVSQTPGASDRLR